MSTSIPRTPLKQIVILGGGFGGVYTAMHLEEIFNATIRAVGEVDVLSVYREDFQTLLMHLPGLRQIFDNLMTQRKRGAAD